MAHSHYRGQLSTNEEVKGPFTEAKDDFSEAFDLLTKNLQPGDKIELFQRPLEPATTQEIMFRVGEMWILINREGLLEIGEGAA